MSDYEEEPIDEIEEEQEQDDRGDDVDPELAELDDDIDTDPEADEEEAEPEPAADKKPRMVPHSRFNEVNDALKSERENRLRLEEELARARGGQAQQPAETPQPQQPAATAYDFDAAEDRYMEAVMEGDTTVARQIRGEIRAQERAEAERAAIQVVESRRAQEDQAREQQTLQQTAAELYKQFPQLNGQSADADPDMIEMTLALRNKYIGSGDSPAVALKKAALKVCGEPSLVDEDEDADDAPRKRINRNLQREARIPPRELGAGERNRPTDYSSLSEDEFSALPEAEKRKARGDYL